MLAPDFTYHPFEELRPVQPKNIEVLEFWKKLRGEAKLPLWSDFDPLDIINHLTNSMMVHCESKESTRIILFGTRLVETIGIDLTGMNFLDVFDDSEKPHSIERTYALRSRPAAGLTKFIGKAANGSPFEAEVVTLPFANDDGSIDRLLLSVTEYIYDRNHPNSVFVVNKKNLDDYRFYDL